MSWRDCVDTVIRYIEFGVADRIIDPRRAACELRGICRLLEERDHEAGRTCRPKYGAEVERLKYIIVHYERWAETEAELMSA